MTVQALSLDEFFHTDHREKFIQSLKASLSETGFVRIDNHGLEQNELKKAYELTVRLFELSIDEKSQYKLPQLGLRGYTDFGKEKAKGQSAGDLKEFWHIGKDLDKSSIYYDRYPTNIWPNELPEFEPTFTSLFAKLEGIALLLLEAIGEAFKLDPDYFPDLINDGNSILRLIHYPATRGFDTVNQMRAAPHADINLMTLLVGATDSGLQLLDKDGNWIDIETNPEEIVVDTGDMMARITGNTLPSTVHRVINPDKNTSARYSMPFFLHPHSDALLSPLPEFTTQDAQTSTHTAPITAGDFLEKRLQENGLK